MLQNATYSEHDTFPSTPEDPFRSLHSYVSTAIDQPEDGGTSFVEVEAELRLANGNGISGFHLGACGYIEDATLLSEVLAAKDDLDKFKHVIDLWYDEARNALLEAEIDIQNFVLAQTKTTEPVGA